MAKTDEEIEDGEQLELIEVTPENAKQIARIAKAYKKLVRERMAIQVKEKDAKEKLKEAVREAHVVAEADGTYRLRITPKMVIEVTPRDELVRVKDDDDAEDGGED